MNCFLKWAISFEEREAPVYDEKAVKEAQKKVFHNWPVQIKLAPVSAPYFIQNNNIQSVTIVRMEVPCCGGLEMAAKKALQNSGKFIPWQVVTISIDGKIIE